MSELRAIGRFDPESIMGPADNKALKKVTTALSELQNNPEYAYMPDDKLDFILAYHSHYWAQHADMYDIVVDDPFKTKYERLESIQLSNQNPDSVIGPDLLPEMLIENLPQLITDYAQMFEQLDLANNNSNRSLVVVTNHRTYNNLAINSYCLNQAAKLITGRPDMYDKVRLLEGPSVATLALPGVDQSFLDISRLYGAVYKTIPPTQNSVIPGFERELRTIAIQSTLAIKREIRQKSITEIVAISGTRDKLVNGSWKMVRPTNTAPLRSVLPDKHQDTIIVAVDDSNTMLSGSPKIERGVVQMAYYPKRLSIDNSPNLTHDKFWKLFEATNQQL